MALRDVLIIMSMWTLIFCGLYCGYRLLKIENHLLGYEWLILGFSASNFFLWYIGVSEFSLNIAMFCDAFSRCAGIPIIATLGLMRVTHDLRLSPWQETAVFAASIALAVMFVSMDWWQASLPYIYLSIGTIFTLFLVYFATQLYRAGNVGHALGVLAADAGLLTMALLEGIIPIPGDETNLLLNFFFLSHLTWALCFGELYFAYRALDRRRRERTDGVYQAKSQGALPV